MGKHTVAVVGCGPRGENHIQAFLENADRFELVGVCDKDAARLAEVADRYHLAHRYTDADAMLAETKPEVFCFVTMPQIRLSLVELGIKHKVGAIVYEKPMALSLAEARRITDLCDETGTKSVVAHIHKYGAHWRKAKEIIESGDIGEVHTIHATAQAWLMQLGTHMIDYMLWINGGRRIQWVVGQVHGKGHLRDSHRSPDYTSATLVFENGVRGVFECGYLAPKHLSDAMFWLDDVMTVYGSHGYVRVCCGAGWEAFTKHSKGEVMRGPGAWDPVGDQICYTKELGDWLDDPSRTHSCNGAVTYHGFEAVMGICLSSLERRKVDLPLSTIPEAPVFDQLAKALPELPTEAAMRLP